MPTHEIFREIYLLKKRCKFDPAIALLLDDKSGRIRTPFSQDLNHAWYVVGDLLLNQNKFGDAINAFRKSLQHRPDDTEAMEAIAYCYSENGRPSLTKRYLLKALSLNDGNDEIYYNLGNALFDLSDYAGAIEMYENVDREHLKIWKLAKKNIQSARKKGK